MQDIRKVRLIKSPVVVFLHDGFEAFFPAEIAFDIFNGVEGVTLKKDEGAIRFFDDFDGVGADMGDGLDFTPASDAVEPAIPELELVAAHAFESGFE